MRNRASIVYDKKTHERFREYCKKYGYRMNLVIKKLVEEWLKRQEVLS